MQATIHNEFLTLTVDTHGAEAVSVRNAAGEEMLWQADKSVWGGTRPSCSPGRASWQGHPDPRGQELQGRAARLCPGSRAHAAGSRPRRHPHGAAGRRRDQGGPLPYDFVLTSTFRLEGKTVCHTLTVENPAGAAEPLPFGIGYHPAFNVPFDAKHTIADYEFRFDRPESPVILDARPNGLLSGKCYYQ